MNSCGYFQVILIISTDWFYYRCDRLSKKSGLLIMFRCLGMQISHALLQNRTDSYRHPRGIDHMAPEIDTGSYNAPRSPVYKCPHQFGGLFCHQSLTKED